MKYWIALEPRRSVAVFRGIAPTERGGYSLREMAQQHGPFEYFNSLLGIVPGSLLSTESATQCNGYFSLVFQVTD